MKRTDPKVRALRTALDEYVRALECAMAPAYCRSLRRDVERAFAVVVLRNRSEAYLNGVRLATQAEGTQQRMWKEQAQ